MPDAIITATASTFGTITGTFAADQSTITGTVAGSVVGTLTGSVGVPGPQGPAGPQGPIGPEGPPGEGGTWGSIVGDITAQTDLWTELGSKYPASNPSGFITSSALIPYLTTATANATFQTLAGMSSYLTTSAAAAGYYPLTGNPSGFLTAASLSGYATESWVTGQGYITSAALSGYAPLASPVFTGDARAVTAALGDNDTSIATTAFVQQELLSGTANARNLEVYVRNQTGSTIPAGSIVYINGATGNRPTITLAQANNDANSAQTFGFTKTSIANNGFGFVIVRGELENINTSALTEGVQLYLSPTTAGTWTTTKPSAPQHLVYVGICVRAHPTQGVVLVAVQNGYELNELHDVQIVSPTNGQVLKYNSTSGLWYNATDSAGVAWGGITGTLSSQTDLQTALDGKYPLTGNPSGFITSSALTGYATESWVTAGFYPLTGNPSGFITSASLSGYALLSGATFTGLVGTVASTTTTAGLRVPHGSAPTTPTNGDIWTTTSGLFARINGGTQQYAPLGSTNTFTGTNTFSGATVSFGTSTAASTINVGTGATLTATTKAVNIGTNGVAGSTTNIAIGSATSTTTTTVEGTVTLNGTTLNLGNSTAASTINVGSGATISGATKTVSIGNGGVSGSTTNVNIANTIGAPSGAATINIGVGSGPPTTTTNLNGTVNATTAAADTNSTVVATTAFVIGQAGSATPLVNGTAAVGTSLRYARQDHVHPSDTTRAPLASPTFTGTVTIPAGASISGYATTASLSSYAPLASPSLTGTPAAPTAAVDTNTTQIATTAYVVGQGYLKSSTASSTYQTISGMSSYLTTASAASTYQTISGMSSYLTTASAASTYAPLNSPAFTGTPSLPTGTTAVTQTAGNNTTAVATTAFVQAALPAFATLAESIGGAVTNKIVAPDDAEFLVTNSDLLAINRPYLTSVTSGSGASALTGGFTSYLNAPNGGAGHAVLKTFGLSQNDQLYPFWNSTGYYGINYSKRIHLSGRCAIDPLTDTNITAFVTFGKLSADAVGDLTRKGIGWKYQLGGGSNYLNLIVHNGTSQTAIATTFQQTSAVPFSWDIVSDGSGGVKLYIDGVERATTSAGPTGTMTSNTPCYTEELVASAAAAVAWQRFTQTRGFIYVQTK